MGDLKKIQIARSKVREAYEYIMELYLDSEVLEDTITYTIKTHLDKSLHYMRILKEKMESK